MYLNEQKELERICTSTATSAYLFQLLAIVWTIFWTALHSIYYEYWDTSYAQQLSKIYSQTLTKMPEETLW